MKVFIWERIEKLTDRWHRGGGCVVIAENLEQAREKLRISKVPVDSEVLVAEPDRVLAVEGHEGHEAGDVFIFQDTGCC